MTMRKVLVLGVLLLIVSTSIVVAAIVGTKFHHPVTAHNSNKNDPIVGPRSITPAEKFGNYSTLIKNQWNRIPYTSVVIFGASDSDDGHPRAAMYAYTLRGKPYKDGRYTNGFVFGEYLAASTLTGNHINSFNYAYGHATVNNNLVNVNAPDTKTQISMYINDITEGKIKRGNDKGGRVLHCIWIGKNDIIEIWNNVISNNTFQNNNANGETSGFQFAQRRVQLEANEVLHQIKTLKSSSQVNQIHSDFLLLLLQPLEIVPNLYYQSKSLSQNNHTLTDMYLKYIGDLAQSYNQILMDGIKLISEEKNPSNFKQSINYFDIPSYWYYIRKNPQQFNFVNTVDACWNSTTGVECKEPDRWQYYDTLHATTKMHEYVAQEITVKVNS